ncbi:hypothetical protein EYD10_14377 [Varanus komodoensis]|nr:hypothetical protein EYD10_14377 [Varanus komodoensis]
MRKAELDESPVGIKIAGRNIYNLRYADDTTLMAESEEELKSLFMQVKEESAKVGLKLSIKKTKMMGSGPLTSWQIDGEEMEMEGEQEENSMKAQTFHLLPDEQLVALHQQLAESQSSYRHKLQSSHEAQQRQAVLVQKLQAKVLQYRNWCKELEQRLEASKGDRREDHSLEKALVQLEEEQQRCENLAGLNILLQEHLDKANKVNGALREDVSKLVADWTKAREELDYKENEWHKEREFFESYMRAEHDRILGIWRQVVTLHRYFMEMKTAVDRDLSELKAEQVKLCGSILVSCFRLSSDMQLCETSSLRSPALKSEHQKQQQLYTMPQKMDRDKEIYQQTQAIVSLHVKGGLAKEDLQNRVVELTALLEQTQKENEEKEKTVKTLRDTVEMLEAKHLEIEYEELLNRDVNEEILSLQHVIKEITQAIINESDATIGSPRAENCAEPCNLLQLNPADPDATLLVVRDRLMRRSSEVQHLKQQLLASQNSVSTLAKQQEQQEQHCNFLRQRLEQLEGERDALTNQLQHLQSTVETYHSDHAALDKSRKELQQQVEVMEEEVRHLRQSNTELQLKGDLMDGEKEERKQELERMLREREYIQEDRNTLEEKHSLLRNELIAMREALEKSQLEGDLAKQEKHEIASALEQAEQSLAKLSSAYNKLKTETADLHDTAAKMGALNEALTLDKVGLNQLILKLEQENQTLLDKVDCLERVRTSSQKKLHQTEKINEELYAEKFRLEQLLQKAEELQENLKDQLRGLQDEQKETYEKLSQAYHQHETANTNLEKAHQESSCLGEVLTKVSKEKELLMHEKATLEVRLGYIERERLSLTEQVEEFRSTKDILESSLFQAQQQVSQLEVTTGQLEMKVQAISQAKEVIQGEVKCLSMELEAAKSKVEQEKEEKAQQLLQAEQKYQETLNQCQIVHKEEMNVIYQELEGERKRHHIEMEEVLKRMIMEKEEIEIVCEKKLLELQKQVIAIQAQIEAELTVARNAKQEMMLEKESERKSLLDEVLQTKKELASTCQQLEHLHWEAKKHQEKEEGTLQGLEAELRDAQSTMETLEKKYKAEIKSLKEEINFLVQQQRTLQSQVQDLESQLLIAKDSCQNTQQHLKEVQEQSKQKVLEGAQLQKMLESERKQHKDIVQQNIELQSQKEEMEHKNAELQGELQGKQKEVEEKHAALQALEKQQSQWEEAERQNSEQHSALQRQWEETKQQNKQLQNQLRETELKNGELKHQRDEAERQNVQLKAVLQKQQEETKRENAMLLSNWKEVQQGYCELQSWKEKTEHQNAELQALLHSQQEELENQNMELQTKQKEMEHQNTVLQKLKKEQSQWKEVECQNAELKETLQALEQEKTHLVVVLEEKEVHFKNLQHSNAAHQHEIAKLSTGLQQAEELLTERTKQMQELNSQMQSLKQLMAEKEAAFRDHEMQLTQDLEESHANEQSLKDSMQRMEAEVSRLRLSLCNTESRADALASECQRTRSARWEAQSQLTKLCSVLQNMLCNRTEAKLEHRGQGDTNMWSSFPLSKEQDNKTGLAIPQLKDFSSELTVERIAEAIQDLRQNLWQAHLQRDEMKKNFEKLKHELSEKEAERDRLSAKAQELQKWLNQIQEEKNVAEGKRGSLEFALKAEIIAFKEENVTLRGKVTTLEKTLESTEKQRKDILNERDALQMAREKMAWELDLFRESVRTSEIRANAMEKMNQSLEQELQTTLSTLRSKHEEVETLQQETSVGKTLQEDLNCLTAMLEKREEEIKSQLQQIQDLEMHRELQNAAVEHLTKDLENQGLETESQKRQIEELRKENEVKEVAVERLNQDLEEMLQNMNSQEEKIQKLEELTQNQRTVMEKLTLNLEEKVKEIKIKEERIKILEENESLQIGALLKDLGDLKVQLDEKDWELASLKQLLQEREEQGVKCEKALHGSLEHMNTILQDKEKEVESYREQITSFQQDEAQRENHLHELHEKLRQMAVTLTQRDQELESQKQQVREIEGEMKTEVKALHELIAITQQSLEEKNKELEFQNKCEEEVERQIRVLLGDVQCYTEVMKERDGHAELQKEQISPLKEHVLKETIIDVLEQLRVMLRGREKEIESLERQKEENEEEKKKLVREMQTNLQEAKQALQNKERQLESLKKENCQLQQQEEKAVVETKSILEKLEFTRASLQDKDKEIESLREQIKELSREKEEELSRVASLQQDLHRINELMTEKEEELHKQAKQMCTYQAKVEATLAESQAWQNRANQLEGVLKKKKQESENKDEQIKQDETPPREREEFLEGSKERGNQMKFEYERQQKQMENEIKVLQENIQHLQHVLKKKDEEAEWQGGKIEQLQETVRGNEKELLTCSEKLKEVITALRLQNSEEGNLQSYIQTLLAWKEEKIVKSMSLQEKDQKLEWQKEKIQHLEDENRVKRQELDLVTTVLKQTESGEIEWRERAQKLSLSLAQSEAALRVLREEMVIVQNMVSERDRDRLHLQEQLNTAFRALEEERHSTEALVGEVDLLNRESDMPEVSHQEAGEALQKGKLTWVAERRCLYRRLQLLQQAVAKLENDKYGLEQHNTQLRDALEQVERERRRLKRSRGNFSLNFGDSESGPQRSSSFAKEEIQILHKQLAELQKQVCVLQKQLSLERKQKQDYIDCYTKTNQELSGLRQELSDSLAAVAREPEATILESETRKLDETLNHSLQLTAGSWDNLLSGKHTISSTHKKV